MKAILEIEPEMKDFTYCYFGYFALNKMQLNLWIVMIV